MSDEELKRLVLEGLAVIEDFMRMNPISMLRVESNARLNHFLSHAKALRTEELAGDGNG